MAAVTAKVDEADLASLDRKLQAIARPALERTVGRAAPYLRDQAKAGVPRSTGALARSVVSEARGLEARVRSPLGYAMTVEFGRHPGTRMPPAGAFGRAGTFAFVVALGIKQRGIKGRFFMKRARHMLENTELPRLLRKAADEIEAAWGRR